MPNIIGKFYKEIVKLDRDMPVLDLACGDGWAGKTFLDLGFKSVTFADARPYRLIPPTQPTNWKLTSIDIESAGFANDIKDFGIIIYVGHLYHSIDPNHIIASFAASGCRHLFLESKTLGLTDIHEFGPARIIHEYEPSSEDEAAYSTKHEMIQISRPSLNWTRQALTEHNFKIEAWYTGPLINNRTTEDDIYGQYIIYATKE